MSKEEFLTKWFMKNYESYYRANKYVGDYCHEADTHKYLVKRLARKGFPDCFIQELEYQAEPDAA